MSFIINSFKKLGKILQPRANAPPKFRKLLEDYGNWTITRIIVCRKPIQSYISKAIDIIKLGNLKKDLGELGYDNLFHLYIILDLLSFTGETRTLLMEKNQVAEYKFINPGQSFGGHCILVSEPYIIRQKGIKLKKFVENGEEYQKGVLDSNFWRYDAKDNNCQVFVLSLIVGNELGNDTLKNFIKQDTEDLIIKPFWNISKKITDLAATADVILHGLGAYTSRWDIN